MPDPIVVVGTGIAVDGILVDDYCATSASGVHAAGDAARRPDQVAGTRRAEHWADVQDQGAAAARTMLGIRTRFAALPRFRTRQHSTTVQVAGHPGAAGSAEADGDIGALEFSAVLRRGGRPVAAVCGNRPAEFRRLRAPLAEQAPPRCSPGRGPQRG